MSTGLPPSNFVFLKREFEEIVEIRMGASGLPSDAGAVRQTIIFDDYTKLSVQEFIKNGFIDYYNYDYYDSDGNIIMKIHSETHKEKELRTRTEPFHLHVKKDVDDLKASVRLPFPNDEFKNKDLYSFIEYILFSRHLKYAFHAPVPASKRSNGKKNKGNR